MESVVLVIHLFLALAIIGLVLIQRSEGGGLGIGGGGGGMGGLATARGTANLLTRATAICALCFFCTSLLLGIMAGGDSRNKAGLFDSLSPDNTITAPAEHTDTAPAPTGTKPAVDTKPAVPEKPTPSAPLAE